MKPIIVILFTFCSLQAAAQIDSAFIKRIKAIETGNTLSVDTLAPPEDGLTSRIRKMRSFRNGVNIQTAIALKIREAQEKDNSRPASFYNNLLEDATLGHLSTLIENCVINLYRQNFSEKEMKQLIRFYKTSAGQKLNSLFILIVAQSVKDAEELMKMRM